VIDTPMLEHLAEPVLRAANGMLLEYVINTHGHLDHHLTNCLFSPQEIVQSAATKEYLSSFDNYIEYYLGLEEYQPITADLKKLHIMPATMEIHNEAKLPFGKTVLEIHFVGAGETTDNLVVFFPKERALFTGDLVYHKVHPFIGNLEKISGWIQALDNLRAFDARLYVPGHGRPFFGEEGLDRQIAYLECFADQFTHFCQKGMTAKEIKGSLNLERFGFYAMKDSFFEFTVDCLVSGYPSSSVEKDR
jgi:glyoxylase-like metal-dependent hydrolase (beta-lactamase superfamily II)